MTLPSSHFRKFGFSPARNSNSSVTCFTLFHCVRTKGDWYNIRGSDSLGFNPANNLAISSFGVLAGAIPILLSNDGSWTAASISPGSPSPWSGNISAFSL